MKGEKQSKSLLREVATGLAGLAFWAVFIWGYFWFADPLIPAPGYAIAYIDIDNHSYLTPPCLHQPELRHLELSTLADIYKSKPNLQADNECRQNEGFFQEGRSGFHSLLEKIGILAPLKSRWNSDGTWNW